jgi:hypothetical protein
MSGLMVMMGFIGERPFIKQRAHHDQNVKVGPVSKDARLLSTAIIVDVRAIRHQRFKSRRSKSVG